MNLAELSMRAQAIRWDVQDLAEKARLPTDTVARAMGRRKARPNPTHNTVAAIASAIAWEERRLRDYLLSLHPINREVE